MKKNIEKRNRTNMTVLKNALYTLQVIIISLAIPALFLAEITHKEKATEPSGVFIQPHLRTNLSTANI